MRFSTVASIVLIVVMSVSAANAEPGKKIRLAQTSTVTNCMMACNSQAAICQSSCLLPPTAGTTSTGTTSTAATSNAVSSTSCQLNCSTQQISCQTTCSRASPSP